MTGIGTTRSAPWGQRVLAQAAFETRTTMRHGEQLMLSIVLPLLFLIVLSTTGILDTLGVLAHGRRPVDLAAPGVLAVCVVSSAFTGQAIGTGFDRRYGVLRHLATTPLGRSGLMAGKLLAVLLVIVTQVIVIAITALALGWNPALAGLPAAVVTLVLATAAFLGLGLLLAGTVRAEATLAGANLLWVLFLAGGGLVVAHQGTWGALTRLLPSGALGDGLRSALVYGTADPSAWLVLAAWAALSGFAAIRWFRWS